MTTLLNTLKIKKTYLQKSTMTSGNAYRITITRNKKRISFIYHDNYLNKSNDKDFLYSLLLDSQAYTTSYNFIDFANNYGYDSDSIKTLNIYKACKKQHDRLIKLFNDDEIQKLENYFSEY